MTFLTSAKNLKIGVPVSVKYPYDNFDNRVDENRLLKVDSNKIGLKGELYLETIGEIIRDRHLIGVFIQFSKANRRLTFITKHFCNFKCVFSKTTSFQVFITDSMIK